MSRIPMDEQQSTIAMSRNDDYAVIRTSDTIMMRKLRTMAEKYPDDYDIVDYGDEIECQVPKSLIKFGHSPSLQAIERGKRLARQRDEYIAREKAKYN